MWRWLVGLSLMVMGSFLPPSHNTDLVRVPLTPNGDVNLATLVEQLAQVTDTHLDSPAAVVELPATGRSRGLTLQTLTDALQPDVAVELMAAEVVISIGPDPANQRGSAAWTRRLADLAARSRTEAERRSRYGFRARPSYRPNDPTRPTVCLIHGLNSTKAVFKHLAPALEGAGYGVVTYDFPYNRDLDETSADFGRDWVGFRRQQGESSRWAIVSHSMGGLLARAYVESPRADDDPIDVAALIMIAPPNHGSYLAHGQTLLQTVQTLQSVRGERRTDPLAYLGDGLGAAADDLSPGSVYLNALNARPRQPDVRYGIIAGDAAYLTQEARRQVESSLGSAGKFGEFGRMLAVGLSGQLDEITDGLGDGCVSVASTRLDGVMERRVIASNHLELIRAPLLFPEPGPIPALPMLLDWLKEMPAPDHKPVGR